MTDFLTRLATRALGLDVPVVPRPASIFEPLEPVAPEHVRAEAVEAARPDAPAAPPAPTLPPADHRQLLVPPAVNRREPPTVALAPHHHRDVEPRPHAPSLTVPPPPAVADASPQPKRSRVRVPEVEPMGRHETTRIALESNSRPSFASRERLVVDKIQTVPPRSPRLGEPPRLPVQMSPRANVAMPPAPEPEVIVEVTIGRVDVRAVAPSAPARRETPKPQSPAVTLDDYLARRNGSSR
jgi:hypothetical protein